MQLSFAFFFDPSFLPSLFIPPPVSALFPSSSILPSSTPIPHLTISPPTNLSQNTRYTHPIPPPNPPLLPFFPPSLYSSPHLLSTHESNKFKSLHVRHPRHPAPELPNMQTLATHSNYTTALTHPIKQPKAGYKFAPTSILAIIVRSMIERNGDELISVAKEWGDVSLGDGDLTVWSSGGRGIDDTSLCWYWKRNSGECGEWGCGGGLGELGGYISRKRINGLWIPEGCEAVLEGARRLRRMGMRNFDLG